MEIINVCEKKEENTDKLFSRGECGSNGLLFKNTGIGLSIAKSICEDCKTEIYLDSFQKNTKNYFKVSLIINGLK